jgi:hypothetical protein
MGSTVCIMQQLGGRTAGRPSGKAGRWTGLPGTR